MSSGQDGAWHDAQYNNRARVADAMTYLDRWGRRSEEARRSQRCDLDARYGSEPAETLDIFPAEGAPRDAPVLVFIHGGYWRALDKKDVAFVAPPFTREGACVVIPNYALAPAVTADTVKDMRKAIGGNKATTQTVGAGSEVREKAH